jgi:hypothetical protein
VGKAVAYFLPYFSESYPSRENSSSLTSDNTTAEEPKPSTHTSDTTADMSFRGGRGGGRGGLKGATWEHDPTIKLESAPSELFPVGNAPSMLFITLAS